MGRPHRLQLVVEQVDVRPTDRVVEVGCGHGVAATLVLDRLTTGRYTGIDRSAAMLAAAGRRNRDAVDAGRARFVGGPFATVELAAATADRLFAARIAAMADPVALNVAARLLAPGGVVVLSFDGPDDDRSAEAVDRAARAMPAAGLALVDRIEVPLASGTMISVVGVRA